MKSNKKRILFVLAILTMAILLSCALVACNKTDTPDAPKKEFTITFDTQGGSEVKPITIAEGATITLPRNPTKEGYIFDGWYLSDEFIEEFNATQTISSNITVYAKWEKYYSKGLKYVLINDEREYEVARTGDCTDNDIVIPSEYNSKPVTSIGDGAFRDCTGLTSVTIPDSVTSIGEIAFYRCTGLTSITIPDSVTSIGNSAFRNCSSLTSITIPDSVTSIGYSAFGGCSELTKITGPFSIVSSVAKQCGSNSFKVIITSGTSIGDSAFQNCSGLTSVIIPNSVTSIGYQAFYNCSGLTSVTIPDSVTSIGSDTFNGCTGLTSITIPDSVTSIGGGAFCDCTGLTSVTIPDSVTSIGYNAFYGCYKLIEVYNKSTLSITAGNSDNGSVAYYAKNVYTEEGRSKLSTDENGYVIYTGGDEKILVAYHGSNTELILPSYITKIYQYAFSGCTGLTSITIPDRVTSINNGVFSGCTGLTSITIPDRVTSIGYEAFRGCFKLLEVYNKSTLSITAGSSSNGYVAYYAKNVYTNEGGSKLTTDENGYVIYTDGDEKILVAYLGTETELTLPAYITQIYENAFSGCTGLASVTIGNGVTSIGDSAFSGCKGLTSVTIGNGVTSIGWGAFLNCTGLTSITIPDSVTSIDSWAFSNTEWYDNQPAGLVYAGKVAYGYKGTMPSTTSIVLKEGTLGIAGSAFYKCTDLTSVIIPNSVTSIGSSAFWYCSGLTSVIIPNSVTSIGYQAFYNCSGLTSVTIPDSVTSIGSDTFNGCTGLTSITIPDSVTSIGGGAFCDCTGLTSVTIPDSVTSIGYNAFYGCYKLIEVYNKSTLSITAGNSDNGSVAYYAKNVYTEEGRSKLSTDENGYVIYTGGDEKILVAYHGSNTELILPSYITKIYQYAFSGCTGLTSITIPDRVTSINNGVFSGCTGLTSITIPDRVTSIGYEAFRGCFKLLEVYNKSTLSITAGSSSNGYVAYYAKNVYTNEGGSKLTTDENGYVIYTDGDEKILVAYLGTETELTLPAYITQIYENAFSGCTWLTRVTIPNSVTSIGDSAFYGCTGLTCVTIGNGVTSIGYSAFNGCSGLTSITFNGTIAQWNAISKGYVWKYNVPATQVICTDGTISISEA